jgi:hypothetical protein
LALDAVHSRVLYLRKDFELAMGRPVIVVRLSGALDA